MSSIGAIADGFTKGMFQVISPGNSQAITINGVSVQAADFSANVTIIRLFSTVDCWVSFGTNPTAVVEGSSSMFLGGGIVEYFEIKTGEKIAVIRNSINGKLYVTEGSTT